MGFNVNNAIIGATGGGTAGATLGGLAPGDLFGISKEDLWGGGHQQSQSTSSGQSTGLTYGSSFGENQAGPWAAQQPYLQGLFSQAQNLYQNQSPYVQQYQNALAQRAQSGSPLNTAAGQGLQETIQGAYMPGGSKYQDISTALLNQIRPSIDSMFAGGRYGSGLHKQGLGSALSDKLIANMGQERQNMLSAMQMAPGQAAQDYMDIAQLGQAGQVPWQQLQNLQGLFGPAIQTSQGRTGAQNYGYNQATNQAQSTGMEQHTGGIVPGLSGLASFSVPL